MAEKKDTAKDTTQATEETVKNETPVVMTVGDLQKMIAEAIDKHDAEKETKKHPVETEEDRKERARYEEKVVVNLFLDNDKYQDDVIVAVNGKAWQIRRGVDVEVPRYVAEVLNSSMKQDRATALRIKEMEEEFARSLG